MSRQPNRPKPQLGDSWVIESDGDDEQDAPTPTTAAGNISNPTPLSRQGSSPRKSSKQTAGKELPPRRRPSRVSARASAEPELIMPSIHEDLDGGSWIGGEEVREMNRRRASRSERVQSARSKSPPPPQEILSRNREEIGSFLRPILCWIYDVMGGALSSLKTPISYVIAIALFLGLLLLLRNLLTSTLYSALSPLCRLPGSSLLNLPICTTLTTHNSNHPTNNPPHPLPPQFDHLMTVQSQFEIILSETAAGVTLPLDMKRGETSIRDLRQIVRFSSLHSKHELGLEFDNFVQTARIASYDLQRFNSHVGRAVDNILATARWTKRVLDDLVLRDDSQGFVASFVGNRVLAPFQPARFTERALLDQYIQHTRVVEEEINRLIAEAQALLLVLQNLEDRLDVIHGISVRDNLHAQGSKDEVLSQLWTMLGGNRGQLGRFDGQLKLLGQVGLYRQSAFAHVSGTVLKLQAMGSELEELRERVGGVELLSGGWGGGASGWGREKRVGGVPLRVHIENIQLGVERLEVGRREGKRVENEALRRGLDPGRGYQLDGNGEERLVDGV